MTCLIVEDQPPAQRILKKYIADWGKLDLKATFPDALQALDYLMAESVDVLFLDIHLPKMSGMEFLKTVPHAPHVILTTAFPDYALESYEFHVVDYLLKPFSFQRFVKAVSKIPLRTEPLAEAATTEGPPTPRQEIFIKSGYEHIKIAVQDLRYLKTDADYTELHLPSKKYLSAEPLRYWQEVLDAGQFIRVHKSYIVNAAHVHKIGGNLLYLTGALEIPIGRAFKDAVMERFLG